MVQRKGELTTANPMLASALKQKQILVDSMNFLVRSTYRPSRKAPNKPHTVNSAPFRPANSWKAEEQVTEQLEQSGKRF